MSAQNLQPKDKSKVYFHIYNKGIENRNIFNDPQDYKVFLDYLRDYLSPLADPESTKRSFTVKGRVFQGVPHQPKNYFGKVDLIAYSLMSNHFHLLVHQVEEGALERFIRSLCTRYSMYFNKKYERHGSLFIGPYKSEEIKNITSLVLLSRYMHSSKEGVKGHKGYTSYEDYLGLRKTSWVKPDVVLSHAKGMNAYKNSVEKEEFSQNEKNLLEGIILENITEHLERRDSTLEGSEFLGKASPDPDLKPIVKIPYFLAVSTLVFLILVGVGIRNIKTSAKTQDLTQLPSPTPSVSGVEDISPVVTEAESLEYKTLLVIKINDGAESVNIRAEPSINSEKIGSAKDGDTFEFVSEESGWYQIKLDDGANAFVSKRYAQIDNPNSQESSPKTLDDLGDDEQSSPPIQQDYTGIETQENKE